MLFQLIISSNVKTEILEDCDISLEVLSRLFDLATDDSSKYVSSLMFILRNKGSAVLSARLCCMARSSFGRMLAGITVL